MFNCIRSIYFGPSVSVAEYTSLQLFSCFHLIFRIFSVIHTTRPSDSKCITFPRNFSNTATSATTWQGSSCTVLSDKLEFFLKEQQFDEAYGLFLNFKQLHGFPKQSVVSRLIVALTYSSDNSWLHKAHDLVLLIVKERPNLLHYDFLTKLGLALARAQMPIHASTILRILLVKHKFLPVDMWAMIFIHMVKTTTGTYLVLDMLLAICENYLDHRVNDKKCLKGSKLTLPTTKIFNLVLSASVGSGTTLEAQQLVEEMMPRIGVTADAGSVVLMSLIYKKNGMREFLMKAKKYVDVASSSLNQHYQKFYDSLLSLHFMFNDIDAAGELILNLYKQAQSNNCFERVGTKDRQKQKSVIVYVGSPSLRTEVKLKIAYDLLINDFVTEMERESSLIGFAEGRLIVSSKAFAKLIIGYIKGDKACKLSSLLIKIEKEMNFQEKLRLASDVINAFIHLGWLETAHDILDDFESAGMPLGLDTYVFLLRAYTMGNKVREAAALQRQMKTGLFRNLSDEKIIATYLSEENNSDAKTKEKPFLADLLVQEASAEDSVSPLVYELNSSIYFFCKAKMINDALKIFHKMQQLKLQATVQTFVFLIDGYSSLHMYREITILWGEIKKRLFSGDLAADRHLFECLLVNFIRGGYFERVMEISGFMAEHSMFIDTWKYKEEFQKIHKNLYRNLRPSEAKDEVQIKRLEHVIAFKRWVGLV